MASVERSYKAQYQGKEKGEDKRKDGKITSKCGPVTFGMAEHITKQWSKMMWCFIRLDACCIPVGPRAYYTKMVQQKH